MGGSLVTCIKILAALSSDSAISVRVHEEVGRRVFAGLSFVKVNDGKPLKALKDGNHWRALRREGA